MVFFIQKYGWELEILRYKTEEDLIQNWKQILFENNRDVDRLNDLPLTDGEMQQILDQITHLRTPLKLNGFINGKTVAVKRDNPAPNGKFNKDFYFHWADANNEPLNRWKEIAQYLLSIPMAHQLIGFYTVADDTNSILEVMRSYQYYAASRITGRVAMRRWADKDQLGGYIWHTTGSSKILTSFKSAQLIAGSRDADKVVFLMDRVELGTQSLLDYRGFADDADSVQTTENTDILVGKLRSDDPANTLIVTSIQKMSRVEEDSRFNAHDIDLIREKRIVFIIGLDRNSFDSIRNVRTRMVTYKLVGRRNKNIFSSSNKLAELIASIKMKYGDNLKGLSANARDENEKSQPYDLLQYNFTKTVIFGKADSDLLTLDDFSDALVQTYDTYKEELLKYSRV